MAEGHAPLANQPPRDTYQDFTGNAGFTTVHARNGWTVQSQMGVAGVSNREKALRFSQDGRKAPRVDLSEYRVDVEKGVARLSLGHVTWGGNRHLVNAFGSRGATVSLRLGRRADLTAAWLHGSTIVGWSHFAGFTQGAVNDAEKSRGWGMRLLGTSARAPALVMSTVRSPPACE